jgi:beta-glucosidase
VFGEEPSAEHQGDRPNVDYSREDGLRLLRKFQEASIPTVSVFVSGRPLWVNPELNVSNAFVAAWLPGTEGGGIADVLVGKDDGTARHDFEGKLSFSWPKTANQANVNIGDENYDPQFAYGYGLSYGDNGNLGHLPEESGVDETSAAQGNEFLVNGNPVSRWRINLVDDAGTLESDDLRSTSVSGNLSIEPADGIVQDDTLLMSWSGAASFAITGPAVDLSANSASGAALQLVYRVHDLNADAVSLQMGSDSSDPATLDVSASLAEFVGGDWHTSLLSLSCFAEQGLRMESITEPLVIAADGALTIQLATVQLVDNPGDANCQL